MTNAHLGMCNFTNMDITGVKLEGAIFWETKLSGAKLLKKDCEAAKKMVL